MSGELSGDPARCDVACSWTRIDQCRDGDGCCPSRCDQTEDSDCQARCGNQVLEQGERCDDGSATPCPSDCDDDDACTEDLLRGSARTCDARCEHRTITAAEAGDGCCPSGANANTDSDCSPRCGNWVREGDEECDDGNRRSGDGCGIDCRDEGQAPQTPTDTTAQCLSLLGNPTDACGRCPCESCDDEVVACRGARDADEAQQCLDLISCATSNRCVGTLCYCQSGTTACTSNGPDGPCRAQIEAAAHSENPSEVLARFSDTEYPLGRVMRLTNCWANSCASVCTSQD